jgi:hypothetical protein
LKSKNEQNLILLFIWLLRKWKETKRAPIALKPLQQLLSAFQKKKKKLVWEIKYVYSFYFLVALIFAATKHGSETGAFYERERHYLRRESI